LFPIPAGTLAILIGFLWVSSDSPSLYLYNENSIVISFLLLMVVVVVVAVPFITKETLFDQYQVKT
jgi:hypothetical protein